MDKETVYAAMLGNQVDLGHVIKELRSYNTPEGLRSRALSLAITHYETGQLWLSRAIALIDVDTWQVRNEDDTAI